MLPGLFAYVGPDTFLPVTSALSALAGAVLFLWGTGVRSVVRGIGMRIWRGSPSPTPAPKFESRARQRVGATTAEVPETAAVVE